MGETNLDGDGGGVTEEARVRPIEEVTRREAPGSKAPARAPTAMAEGDLIGEYRVEGKLGSGAFGCVYSAVQPLIGKRVAIKVLELKHSVDQDIVTRFVAEARAVNKIGHSNIVDIFSFGELPDGRRYFVMERLEGRPLHALLRERGRLDLDEALAILGPVGRALDAAHAAGIAHRDLKPDNIYLCRAEDGGLRPKLLDFGVAKLLDNTESAHSTASGMTLGTPAYMSPEQCVGKGVDHRSDIYAFGVLAYRMLVGRLPFEGEAGSVVMAHHLYDEPTPPHELRADLPVAVGVAILRMLAKDKEARPQSLAEAMTALDLAAGREATPQRSSARSGSKATIGGTTPPRSSTTTRWVVAALAVSALVGVGVVALRRAVAGPSAPIHSATARPMVDPAAATATAEPTIPPPTGAPLAAVAPAPKVREPPKERRHVKAPNGPRPPRPNDLEPWR